jgi:guanylate kinase
MFLIILDKKITMTPNIEKNLRKKKILVISAPSGGGKSIVANYILSNFIRFSFSISSTTRSIRAGEKDKKNYYFLDKDTFINKINNNEFVEYENFFGNYYGTMATEIERIFSLNKIPLLDVDVKGAFSIKKYYSDDALLLFLKPPNIEVLKQRLVNRNTETTEQLEKRIARAEMEIEMSKDFDCILINDDLDTLLYEVKQLITTNFIV